MNQINDAFLLSVLARAGRGAERISLDSVVADLLLSEDPTFVNVLRPCLPDGVLLQELEPVQSYLAASTGQEPIPDPLKKAGLDIMGLIVAYGVMQLAFSSKSHAVLTTCALALMKHDNDRKRWQPLDIDRLREGLQQDLGIPKTESPSVEDVSETGADKKDSLSVADLSGQAEGMPPFDESPLAGDLAYLNIYEQIARTMYRRKTGHLILVADKGVGVGAVMIDFARFSRSGRIPFLSERQILSVQCRSQSASAAGGELAAILGNVCSESGRIVCVHGLAAALANASDSGFIGWLVTTLDHVRSSVIAVMTPLEYEDLVLSHPDLSALFAVVHLPEPSVDTAIRMLGVFAQGLHQEYGQKIEPDALRGAVALSHSYILNDRLPGKAIRILRDICEVKRFDREQLGKDVGSLTGADVASKVSDMTGIPAHTLAGLTDGTDYRSALMEPIVGQQEAVEEVAVELGLIKAGLVESGKPASVMLFVGQTGTGKTEMAKALARLYSTSKRLKTFTLGNFIESHSVSGIIGVPAGYVGHDKGGRLVNELLADPYGVFLLDEADKAHPDVLQPFLNLFDEGWIGDQRGQKAHADRAIFILTTNVAQRQIGDMFRAGKSMGEVTSQVKDLLSQIRHSKSSRPVFSPEFLARIGRIVVFRPLDQAAMEGICRRLVNRMRDEWRNKRGKILQVHEAIVEQIAGHAFALNEKSKGKEGGRAVRRLLNDRLSASILREIARRQDDYRRCAAVQVYLNDATAATSEADGLANSAVREYQVSFVDDDSPIAEESVSVEFIA